MQEARDREKGCWQCPALAELGGSPLWVQLFPFSPLGLGSVLLQSCLIPAFCWEEKGMGAAGRGGERREWGFLGLSVIYRSQVWSPRFLGVMV